MTKHEVVIDGQIYVPATDVSPTIDTILEAIWESYMGTTFGRWNDANNARELWVGANEDGNGDTLEEFAARIAKMVSR